ncbi:Na+/H+ antiporter subunit E [Wenzhouxiangella sp. XN79A]|uniref:Na+/H+ antiporter subunit E n=1 Tax=Wenzhouxiangella sp. XN79A TaxID=2724193 RepID=UPI00144A935A|nr:Na+/H+ antiporter subunit E [Wenzhouxiangella sp. XN79A]NKI34943.1 Na+/H+ antiporter subunit E [Wenzhouxiangella sp. XN79A]
MRYLVSLALLLALLWLGISGVYKPLLFLLGGTSVLFVVWMSRRMDVVGVEHNPVLYSWRLPIYWGWLVWEIVKANVAVARAALWPDRHLRPQVVRVPVRLATPVAKVTYANSITLTPGTVTLLLEPDFIEAHALLESTARDLESGEMERRIAWLENRP